MRLAMTMTALGLGLALPACDEKPAAPSAPTGAATAVAAATAKASAATTAAPAAALGADLKDEDLPVESDYEEEADKEITDANYAAELDKLEKELADAPAAPAGAEDSD